LNNRRKLLIVLGAATFTSRAVFAQTKKPPVVVAWLGGGRADSGARGFTAFKEGMAALGWTEGQQFVIDGRSAEGRIETLKSLAEELVAKRPNIIVTTSVQATVAAANASQNVPIVQANGASPVAVGLAKSLARPGGMVTGLTNLAEELSSKYLELLLVAAPKLKRVGFLLHRGNIIYALHMKNARSAVEHYRIEARFADVGKAEEIEPALARLAKEGVEGLVLTPSPGLFFAERRRILTFALARRWPVISGAQRLVADGALLSYSAAGVALHRRAAWYVDRILKGTKAGDLGIEQPTTFEMAVNLKTAKTLGLTMPPEIMMRATRVIE
jgi:putative ABC transport system substrate-binding protein